MELDAYYADFEKNFWNITDLGFWKLERQQVFKEPGYDSWTAFAHGDWDESIRLLEAGRADMLDYHRKIAEHGFVAARVRVVEEPISAYLQWELNALRVRDECGGGVRVVRPAQITRFETDGPLPEIYTLGPHVMYEAVYDEEGVLDSVVRYLDRGLIARCQRFVADLYEMGEPLGRYFARQVAPLPPPGPQRQG
ncbi:DUF6879 family protein [Actinomadura sp. DC4]|uniref:DUF6879 family protein n=1 Tax=Actinomadura sp. DC4 TaxID=3055069 RepID=UPI0025AF0CD8|nr:DUF6879 family protein [Actinomadura sp. DC4]MDN3358372.1 hypothetical protein [Actinomadura sp. DC4]